MANMHSRKGFALGLATALGATGIVGAAPAVAAETLALEIADQTTNGVLATTWENDFELSLDWGAQTDGLENLHYDISIVDDGADASFAYASVDVSRVTWDAVDDEAEADTDVTDVVWTEDADATTLAAPAASSGDDNTVRYLRTVTGNSVTCEGVYTDVSADTPPTGFAYYGDYTVVSGSTAGNDHVGALTWTLTGGTYSNPEEFNAVGFNGFSGCSSKGDAGTSNSAGSDGPTYTVSYTAVSGDDSGSIPNIVPAGFDSLVTIEVSEDGASGDYFDVTVHAFIDTNDNSVLDNGESYSNEVTVRFWNPDALTPVLTLDNDGDVWYETEGEQGTVDTETYISQELNNSYTTVLTDVQANFSVVNDRDYAASRDGYVYPEDIAANYKAALSTFAFGVVEEDYAMKHLFLAKTLWVEQEDINRISVIDSSDNETDSFFSDVANNVDKIVSGPLTVAFVERDVTAVDGEVVEATLVLADAEDANIRADVETVTYTYTLVNEDDLDEDGNPAPVAGAAVSIVGDYEDSLEGTLTINGVSVVDAEDDGSGSFTVTATSNAAGEVVLEIESSNPHEDLYVFFDTVTTQGADFDVDADLYWDVSDWFLVDELNSEDSGSIAINSLRTVAVGDSTTIHYDVRDQWSQAPSNGAAQIKFYEDGFTSSARGFTGNYAGPVAVVNGSASFTVTDLDPESVEGTFDVRAELDVRAADGSWIADYDEDTTRIEYVNDATVALIDQDEDTASADIAYVDFITVNDELERLTEAQMDTMDAISDYDRLDGYVRNADGLGLAGVRVTASASGLQFMDEDSWEFWAVGSLTLFTDENGYYSFDVAGHTVGEHTVTVTAGGKSATATYEVTDGNVRAHNVAITSAFAAKTGTADTLTALVTDRYGNAKTSEETVTFSVVSGSGYIQETDGTVTTDEDGVATATLIVLGGEIGFNSTVRAAITQDDFAAAGNSAAAQRSAGDTNLDKTTAWTKLQTDGTAKMYAKNIVGAGKVQFFHNGNEIAWVRAADALNPKLRAANGAFYLVRTVELVDGKNVLEVYIDGERVRRTAYSK